MDFTFLQKNSREFLFERRLLIGALGVMILSNVFLCVSLLWKTEHTILVPFDLQGPCSVKGHTVSREYLEQIGRDVAMLLLDISPSSYPYKHGAILKLIAPKAYGPLKAQLLKEGEAYKALQLSTSFKPQEITALPDSLRVHIKGTLTSYVSQKQVRSSIEQITLTFTHQGGLLLLESVSGGNPHAS